MPRKRKPSERQLIFLRMIDADTKHYARKNAKLTRNRIRDTVPEGHISISNRSLDALERHKYVNKAPHPDGGLRNVWTLTDAGREALRG